MAMAFYLTMRGIPQLYYGTEIMMSHPGSDSHGLIRSDFPGGWPGDSVNAFTGAGLSDAQGAAQTFLKRLLVWRRSADVVHDGQLMQFTPVGNVYVYFRYDADDTVMVAFNRGDEAVAAINRNLVTRGLRDVDHSFDGVNVLRSRLESLQSR